jgi:hypothetical protein
VDTHKQHFSSHLAAAEEAVKYSLPSLSNFKESQPLAVAEIKNTLNMRITKKVAPINVLYKSVGHEKVNNFVFMFVYQIKKTKNQQY